MATGNTPSHADPPLEIPRARVGALLENPVTGSGGRGSHPSRPTTTCWLAISTCARAGG